MKLNARIYVAGHRGLVGSAICRALVCAGYDNLILRNREELDLTEQVKVHEFFDSERPEYVFIAAAKVGGLVANNAYPADFIYRNLLIEMNVIESAHKAGVERLLFLGSSCLYPKFASQPIPETSLLSGALEPTNRPYAIAKIAGIEMCWAYNRQYGTRYLTAMPTNIYGPGDNYDLETSHVIPAMIRKMHNAKVRAQRDVEVWGSGTPRREFLYSDDLADACLFLMNLGQKEFESLLASDEEAPIVNVGSGREQTIAELAQMVAEVVGFQGTLRFDRSRPDGTPRKLVDNLKMSSLGWQAATSLRQGLEVAYQEFLKITDPISASAYAGR